MGKYLDRLDHPALRWCVVSGKHSSPEYLRNARHVRALVAQARRLGAPVECWRCGRELHDDEPFDVGHVHPSGGEGLDNLAPEHRYRTPWCQGNRAAGGRLGRAIQTGRAEPAAPVVPDSSSLLDWCAVFFSGRCNPRLRLQLAFLPLNSKVNAQ